MKKLLKLNRCGFIPGPKEDEKTFLKRVSLTKSLFLNPHGFLEKEGIKAPFLMIDKIKKPNLSWVNPSLLSLFDIYIEEASTYFSDHKLKIFQGAATWFCDKDKISIPILQVRKKFKKGSFLGIYELEDVLAHEYVHFARSGFDEKTYEEFFAYLTSSRWLRKNFGPIFSSEKEVFLFLGMLILACIFQYLYIFFSFQLFSNFTLALSFLFSSSFVFFMFRLGIRKFVFNRCYKNLKRILKNKKRAMYVLFRLTDKEIKKFSKKKFDILQYAKEQGSIRWKVIYNSYFID